MSGPRLARKFDSCFRAKHSHAIATLLSAALLLSLPANARARIVVAESIDWVLATSDRVFVGKVVNADKLIGRDNKEYELATVAISKTLKGTNADQETFLLPHYTDGPWVKQWMDEGIPILFCLVKNDGKRIPFSVEKVKWILRDQDGGAVLLGKSKHFWTGSLRVLTRDFEVLTEKEAILKFVERSLEKASKTHPPRSHTLDVPFNTAVFKEVSAKSAVKLIIPIDEQLEELGQIWCKSESPRQRSEGARILRHFKTKKNVEILKSLLGDPGTSEWLLPYRKKHYYVRQAAFDALRELGVNVDSPILEVPLDGRNEPDPKPDDRKR
jgi:hypothetical protein